MPSKQPFKARTRSTSRGRSPSRKSPARKSPSRKSPGRPVRNEANPPAKTSQKTVVNSVSNSSVTRRHSSRLIEKKQVEEPKVKPLKRVIQYVKGEDGVVGQLRRVAVAALTTIQSLILPVCTIIIPFLLSLMCTAKKCELLLPDIPRRLSAYYDQRAVLYCSVFTLVVFLLSFVPVGKVARVKGNREVRCNGFLSIILMVLGVIYLLHQTDFAWSSAYLFFRHFLVTFAAFSFILSVLLYIKSFFLSKGYIYSKGNTGYYVADFVTGRELCPLIRSFDVKLFLYRLSLLVGLMLNFIIVAKDMQARQYSQTYSPTLLVECGLQVAILLDLIIFEDVFLVSSEYSKTSLGFGYTSAFLTFPFMYSFYPRFILSRGHELPWYCLVGIVLLAIFGYTLFRSSLIQKVAFKRNPSDKAFAHLESIPASGGKRVLVSGWFGIVRHPDYLGAIIFDLSVALICGFDSYLPWVTALILLFVSLGFVFTDEKHSKTEYGLAWNTYSSKVPYRLIPKVF